MPESDRPKTAVKSATVQSASFGSGVLVVIAMAAMIISGPMGMHYEALPTESSPPFHEWLDAHMCVSGVRNVDLAEACNELRYLRSENVPTHGHKFAPLSERVELPKKEIGQFRDGKRLPGAEPAYRIGHALETKFQRPTSGLDALIIANRWPDALGCLGQFIYDGVPAEISPEEEQVFKAIFANRLYGQALPSSMHPAISQSWIRWITDPKPKDKPHRLHPRIHAAYILANSSDEMDRAVAVRVLRQWEPVPLKFYVNRKG
jgi:hypothetical protein